MSFVCQRLNWIRSQPLYVELLHPQIIGALVRDVNWGKYFNYSGSDHPDSVSQTTDQEAVDPDLMSQTTDQVIKAIDKLAALRTINEVLPQIHPEYEKV